MILRPDQIQKVVVISDATRPDSRFPEALRIKDGKVVDPDKSKSSLSAAEQFEKKRRKYSKRRSCSQHKPSARPKKGIISKIVGMFSSKQPKKLRLKPSKKL